MICDCRVCDGCVQYYTSQTKVYEWLFLACQVSGLVKFIMFTMPPVTSSVFDFWMGNTVSVVQLKHLVEVRKSFLVTDDKY